MSATRVELVAQELRLKLTAQLAGPVVLWKNLPHTTRNIWRRVALRNLRAAAARGRKDAGE